MVFQNRSLSRRTSTTSDELSMPCSHEPAEVGGSDPAYAEVAELYAHHRADLCRYALRYTESFDVAEDAVEDVFRRVLNRADELAANRIRFRYLARGVRNELLKLRRRRRIREAYRRAVAIQARRPVPTPMEQMQQRDMRAEIDRAIDALPVRCREAFILVREQGLTYAEAAHAMGISVKTVEEQLRRAGRRLRQWLAHY